MASFDLDISGTMKDLRRSMKEAEASLSDFSDFVKQSGDDNFMLAAEIQFLNDAE